MSRVSKFPVIGSATVLLLGFALLVGCQRKDSAATSSDNSASTNDPNEFRPATAPVGPTNFSVPFHGVIKAKEQRDLMLNSAEITYTVGKDKIRREAIRTTPVGKLADLGLGAAGIICDVQTDRVVLYRTGQPGKFYTRMSVAEYRKLVTGANAGTSDLRLDILAVKPTFLKHVGTFFVDIPQPIPTGHAVNLPEARTAGGLPCDLLTIQLDDTLFEVFHCQKIKVDRELLELVELRLPAEVTGFPCFMRRLERIAVQPPVPTGSRTRQLLQKGASWAGKMAEKALKREVELLQIIETIPSDAAFTLDDAFVEVSTLDELHLRFAPPSGGHDDWD